MFLGVGDFRLIGIRWGLLIFRVVHNNNICCLLLILIESFFRLLVEVGIYEFEFRLQFRYIWQLLAQLLLLRYLQH